MLKIKSAEVTLSFQCPKCKRSISFPWTELKTSKKFRCCQTNYDLPVLTGMKVKPQYPQTGDVNRTKKAVAILKGMGYNNNEAWEAVEKFSKLETADEIIQAIFQSELKPEEIVRFQ